MLKLALKYRKSTYFNDKDYFVCDNGMNGLLVTKLEFSKGFWWTVSSLHFKAETLKLINSNELLGKEVKLKGLDYYGKIANFLSPIVASPLRDLNNSGYSKSIVKGSVRSNFGICWYGGKQVRENGLVNYFVETNELELKF